MSDLKPRGIPAVINGEERHLLFTLNAINVDQRPAPVKCLKSVWDIV